jgi:hypothetical protein
MKIFRFCFVTISMLILGKGFSQQRPRTEAQIDSIFLESRKGAPQKEINELKKKIKSVKLITYKSNRTLIRPEPYYYDTSEVKNEVILKGGNKNNILDLTYSENIGTLTGLCYNPRNAIVLYDKKGKIIGYIEICFECIRIRTESDIPQLPQLSQEGFDNLMAVFIKYGLISKE